MFREDQYEELLEIFHRSEDWQGERTVKPAVDAFWHSYIQGSVSSRNLQEEQLEPIRELVVRLMQHYEGKGSPVAYLMGIRDRITQEILESQKGTTKKSPNFSMSKLFKNIQESTVDE